MRGWQLLGEKESRPFLLANQGPCHPFLGIPPIPLNFGRKFGHLSCMRRLTHSVILSRSPSTLLRVDFVAENPCDEVNNGNVPGTLRRGVYPELALS